MILGVLQRSCLGPLLLIFHVNHIYDCLNFCKVLKYADDLKFSCNNKQAFAGIQLNLLSLADWLKQWQLQFKASKCTIVHFGYDNPGHTYQQNGEELSNSLNEKDLGVIICSNLKPTQQVTAVVKKAERSLAILKKTVVKRNGIFLKLYKQLGRPHLEYATTVWNPYSKRDVQKLEHVQQRATKCIGDMKDKDYEERLIAFKLDSFEKT